MNETYQTMLKKFRQENNKTQVEISNELGISQEHYSNIETGTMNPSIELHTKFCKLFLKPSDCFFTNKNCSFLSAQKIDDLLQLSDTELEIILRSLQSIYECKREILKDE